MKGKKTITLSTKKPTYQGYSYAFKVAIVDLVENGQLSANQAAKIYDVSPSGIRKWAKKYGNRIVQIGNIEKLLLGLIKLLRFKSQMQLFTDIYKINYFSKERGQSPLSFEWSLPYLSPSKKLKMAHITES